MIWFMAIFFHEQMQTFYQTIESSLLEFFAKCYKTEWAIRIFYSKNAFSCVMMN